MKKRMAGILGLMLLVLVVLSSFYIAAEEGHECTGEDCPVCAFVQQCENTLRRIGSGLAMHVAAILPMVLLYLSAILTVSVILQDTPVSRKVRMDC